MLSFLDKIIFKKYKMKKFDYYFRSFYVKVMLVLILSMLFIGVISNLLVSKFALNSQFDQFRDKLKIIAQTAALMIDADTLVQIPLNEKGMDTPQYKTIAEQLTKIKKANPPLVYIYTMTKPEADGMCQFIVDPDIPTEEEIQKGLTSYPGDRYDASLFPEMLKAYEGPIADKKFGTDAWGKVLSGYAPIVDKNGKAVAILGVDIRADDIHKVQKEVRGRSIFVLVLGIIVSVIFGALLSYRIAKPVKDLSEGTRHVALGDLTYKVPVHGDDEIGKLTKSFNNMTKMLAESTDNLNKAYTSVVQSIMQIMEAKNSFTKGHSERVSKLAEKIATLMGFPQKEIEMVRETALLHNIGNVCIREDIISKKEKLSDDERKLIQNHTVAGEEILKPLLLKDMLSIVRGHHERYDGKGYPDGLSGDKINIFAQILAISDAYDAMTSSRPYRTAMTKEQAIDEITKNRGEQFDVRIVTAFLQVLLEKRLDILEKQGEKGEKE